MQHSLIRIADQKVSVTKMDQVKKYPLPSGTAGGSRRSTGNDPFLTLVPFVTIPFDPTSCSLRKGAWVAANRDKSGLRSRLILYRKRSIEKSMRMGSLLAFEWLTNDLRHQRTTSRNFNFGKAKSSSKTRLEIRPSRIRNTLT